MRKIFSIVLILILLCTSYAYAQWSGNGTRSNPYLIQNREDLRVLLTSIGSSGYYRNVYFKQTADIDMSGVSISGYWESEDGTQGGYRIFAGNYDGDGHTVSKLKVTGQDKVSMFGELDGNASVSNLNLVNYEMRMSDYIGREYSYSTEYSVAPIANGVSIGSSVTNVTALGNVNVNIDYNYMCAAMVYVGGLTSMIDAVKMESMTNCVAILNADIFVNVPTEVRVPVNIYGLCHCANVSNCMSSANVYGLFPGDYNYYPFALEGNLSNNILISSNIIYDDNYGDRRTHNNCYYDSQMTQFDYVSPISGFTAATTAELTSGNIMNKSSWTETEGIYPRPAAIANTDVAILAASPIFLDSRDNFSNVSFDFNVSTDNNVTWYQEDGIGVEINGTQANVTLQEDPNEVLISAFRNRVIKTIRLRLASNHPGSAVNPLTIDSEQDLFDFADAINTFGEYKGVDLNDNSIYYFRLTNDIVLTRAWTPIGYSSYNLFAGNFDGGHHKISGLMIADSYTSQDSAFGLFNYIENAEIYDLEVKCRANADSSQLKRFQSYRVAGIAADATSSKISNCKVSGYIKGGSGIVGEAENVDIINCVNEASLSFYVNSFYGGIAGKISNSRVSGCTNIGSVMPPSLESEYVAVVGGIVGCIESSSIESCVNYGMAAIGLGAPEGAAGGIVGYTYGGSISNCAYYCSVIQDGASDIHLVGIVQDTDNSTVISNNIVSCTYSELESLEYDPMLLIYWDTNGGGHLTSAGNYFDKQLCPINGIAIGIVGLETSQMIGTSPSGLSSLDPDKWTFRENMYPVPVGCLVDTLAVAPIVLAHSETLARVCSNFTVPQISGIEWQADMEDQISVNSGTVVVMQGSEDGDSYLYVALNYGEEWSLYDSELDFPVRQYQMIVKPSGYVYTDPLAISSAQDFYDFANALNGRVPDGVYHGIPISENYGALTITLTQDIEIDLSETTTIGEFHGRFNGAGHTIQINSVTFPVIVDSTEQVFFGLFSNLSNAFIDGLNIVVTGDTIVNDYYNMNFGLLIGKSYYDNYITNCNVELNTPIDLKVSGCGLFCAVTNHGNVTFENCNTYGTGAIIGDCNKSGFVYYNNYSYIEMRNCTNNVDLYFNGGGGCGGFIETSRGPFLLESCTNNGNIYSQGETYVEFGGIICRAYIENDDDFIRYGISSSAIRNCVNNGNLSGARIGGILGEYYKGVANSDGYTLCISNCVNTGNIIGMYNAAGIAGTFENRNVVITNCANYGVVKTLSTYSSLSYGGIVGGDNTATGTINNNVVASCSSGLTSGGYAICSMPDNLDEHNNYYNEQLSDVKDASKRKEFTRTGNACITRGMVGDGLRDKLGEGWTFDDNLYPLPEGIEETDKIRLSRIPIFLKADAVGRSERFLSVISDFEVPVIDGVTWTTDKPAKLNVPANGGTIHVTLGQTADSVKLIASYNGISKEFDLVLHEQQGTTADNPYQIANENDFSDISSRSSNGSYGLFYRATGSLITYMREYVEPFSGTFDGNGQKIDLFYLEHEGNEYRGLFGMTDHATIKNVQLILMTNSDSDSNTISGQASGGLVGRDFGSTITGCSVFSQSIPFKGYVNQHSVEQEYFSMYKESYIGGLVGYADSTNISECLYAGLLIDTIVEDRLPSYSQAPVHVGGFVGHGENTSISNSVSCAFFNEQNNVLQGDSQIVKPMVKYSAMLSEGSDVTIDSCLVLGAGTTYLNGLGNNEDPKNYKISAVCSDGTNVTASNCYYDKQMFLDEFPDRTIGYQEYWGDHEWSKSVQKNSADNGITGLNTREIAGTLFSGSPKWTVQANKYPVPAALSGMMAASLVSEPLFVGENDKDISHVTELSATWSTGVGWTGDATSTSGRPVITCSSNSFNVPCVSDTMVSSVSAIYTGSHSTAENLSLRREVADVRGLAFMTNVQEIVCEGHEVSFSVSAPGATNYDWKFFFVNGEDIVYDTLSNCIVSGGGANDSSVTILLPKKLIESYEEIAESFKYLATRVSTTIAGCSEPSVPFQILTISPSVQERYELQGISDRICQGSEVDIIFNFDSVFNYIVSDIYDITWYSGNTELAMGDSYMIPSLNEDTELNVVFKSRYNLGDEESLQCIDTVTINLRPDSEEEILVRSNNKDQHLCQGELIDEIVLSAEDAIYTLPAGIFADYDTINNLLTLSGRPYDTINNIYYGNFSYKVSNCGYDVEGYITVDQRPSLDVTGDSFSRTVAVGDEMEPITLSSAAISTANISVSWAGTDGANILPSGLSYNRNTGVISGTPDESGDYTYSVTLPAYGSCPSRTYENYIGVYDATPLSPAAQDNALCSGESTILSTSERPSDMSVLGDYSYVWTLEGQVDTLGTDNRITVTADTLPGDYTYTVTLKGNKTVGEIEMGDYLVEDAEGFVAYKNYEIDLHNGSVAPSYAVIKAESDTLTLMSINGEGTTWTAAPEIIYNLGENAYMPTEDDANYILRNYDIFNTIFDGLLDTMLLSTEKDSVTAYAFDLEHAVIVEVPKTEVLTCFAFRKMPKSEITRMNGRTIDLNKSGSITITISDHKSIEVVSDDILCNSDTATVSLATEYTEAIWYNTYNTYTVFSTDMNDVVLPAGRYFAVLTDGICSDTVQVRVRSLDFDLPADTLACNAIDIDIPLEEATILVNGEEAGHSIHIAESGRYTITVLDALDSICMEEKTIDVSIEICGVEVYGLVTAAGRTPIPGARVWIDREMIETDAEGAYRQPLTYGEHVIRVSADGYNSVCDTMFFTTVTEHDIWLYSPDMNIALEASDTSTYPYVERTVEMEIRNDGDGPLTWSSIIDQDIIVEASDTLDVRSTRSLWDGHGVINTHGTAEQAIGTDGYYIYTSSWMRAGEFSKYTTDGYLETFIVHGVGKVRNLAYDGRKYFYATDNSNVIYKIDMDKQELVSTIEVEPEYHFRSCAYNKTTGTLLAGDWNQIYEIVNIESNTPSVLTFADGLNNVYSLTYDALSPGGPYIWAFTQQFEYSESPSAMIVQLNAEGRETGITHNLSDASLTNSSIAGGICVSEQLYDDKYVLLANVQNSNVSNSIFVCEIGKKSPWLKTNVKHGTIPPHSSQNVTVTEFAKSSGEYTATLKFKSVVLNPQISETTFRLTASDPHCLAISGLTAETDTFKVVSLSWDEAAHNAGESVSYLVYETSQAEPLDTVYEPYYTASGLMAGRHCYYVRSFVRGEVDCVSESSDTVCADIQAMPCDEPIVITARPYSDNIGLSWSSTHGVEYYDVYRGDDLIASGIQMHAYYDTTVAVETDYCYHVIAYFTNDECQPVESPESCARIEANVCNDAPVVTVGTSGNVSVVSWTPVDSILTYSVYRDGRYVSSTKDTVFFDMNLEYETEYCYTVEIACSYGFYNMSEVVCATTGFEENAVGQWATANINVYPNPAREVVYIEGLDIESVSIMNTLGQIVFEKTDAYEDQIMVNTSGFKPGAYAVKVVQRDGSSAVRKIIISE